MDVVAINQCGPSPARSSSYDSLAQVQAVEITYPSIREASTILSDPASGLTIGQVEKIYCALEKIGIFTVDQVGAVDDHYLEMEVGIPMAVVSSFREECRRDEIDAEGYGVSAPRE